MLIHFKRKNIVRFIYFLLLSVVACSNSKVVRDLTPTLIAPSITSTSVKISTSVPMKEPPLTLPPSLTTSKLTLTPTITQPLPTLTPIPFTPTFAPTLTSNEAQTLILELLKNDEICHLPCWWGITPGKTTWEETKKFFFSIGVAPEPYIKNIGWIFSSPILEHDIQIQQYYLLDDTSVIEMFMVGVGMVQNNKAVFGEQVFAEDMQNYMLTDILSSLGEPEIVMVATYDDIPDPGWVPFHLLLFYSKHGVMIDYQGPRTEQGDQFEWCPDQTNIAMWLWSPDPFKTMRDIFREGPNLTSDALSIYRPLESVTSMTIHSFYQNFLADNTLCIQTPSEKW